MFRRHFLSLVVIALVAFALPDVHSIGDVAIHQPDPDIIWVGTGERANRRSKLAPREGGSATALETSGQAVNARTVSVTARRNEFTSTAG